MPNDKRDHVLYSFKFNLKEACQRRTHSRGRFGCRNVPSLSPTARSRARWTWGTYQQGCNESQILRLCSKVLLNYDETSTTKNEKRVENVPPNVDGFSPGENGENEWANGSDRTKHRHENRPSFLHRPPVEAHASPANGSALLVSKICKSIHQYAHNMYKEWSQNSTELKAAY